MVTRLGLCFKFAKIVTFITAKRKIEGKRKIQSTLMIDTKNSTTYTGYVMTYHNLCGEGTLNSNISTYVLTSIYFSVAGFRPEKSSPPPQH